MKNRRDDDGCCSRIFLKSIMIVFNIFFWLSGLVFLLMGLASLFLWHKFVSLMDSPVFPMTTYLFLAIGGLVAIVGVIGCLGTLREIRGCLIFYTFILMAVFLMEASVGVLAYMYEHAVHEELTRNLNQTIVENYYFDEGITHAVDDMQETFQCCGPTNYTDWMDAKWLSSFNQSLVVPDSCCITPDIDCGYNTDPSNIHTEGCIDKLERFVRLHLILVGGISLGLSVLQIFGIFFSCCLAGKIKDERIV